MATVDGEVDRREFVLNLSPEHINRVVFLRRVLVFKVVRDFLEPAPHSGPPFRGNLVQPVNDQTGLESLPNREEEGEFLVVDEVFERKLDPVADDDRHAVADDSVE